MLKVSIEALKQPRQTKNRVVIGYASGTPTHDHDFLVVKPALQQMLCQFPQVDLHIIGPLNIGGDWGPAQPRIKLFPFVPWQELPHLLTRFDINLAPLEANNPFCEAKSELKYLEAGLVQVPTIASRTDAFRFAINAGNGFLAETTDDWIDALGKLVVNPQTRLEVGQRAYADVLERYHPLTRGRDLLQTLNQIHQDIKGLPLFIEGEIQRRTLGRGYLFPQEKNHMAAKDPLPALPLWQRAYYALRNKGWRILCLQSALYLRRVLKRKSDFRVRG